MEFLWTVLVSVASAAFAYFIAERNNMSKVGWPILSFFLPLLGLIVTLIVAFMKQKEPV